LLAQGPPGRSQRARSRSTECGAGILLGFVADDPRGQAALATLSANLAAIGWVDGRNVRIDYRLGGSNAEELRKYAAELVTRGPDVLLGTGGSSSAALFQTTRSIPIVFAKADIEWTHSNVRF
jgi:putative ABC transport system substrate-binding protein